MHCNHSRSEGAAAPGAALGGGRRRHENNLCIPIIFLKAPYVCYVCMCRGTQWRRERFVWPGPGRRDGNWGIRISTNCIIAGVSPSREADDLFYALALFRDEITAAWSPPSRPLHGGAKDYVSPRAPYRPSPLTVASKWAMFGHYNIMHFAIIIGNNYKIYSELKIQRKIMSEFCDIKSFFVRCYKSHVLHDVIKWIYHVFAWKFI